MKAHALSKSLLLLTAALGVGTTEAVAQVRGASWSVLTGRTVGTNENVLFPQVGWPGVSLTFLHGMTRKLDLGGIFNFNYGFEGDVERRIRPGLKLQGLLRVNLLDSKKVNLGIHFAPGPLFYFYGFSTIAGMAIPVGFDFGIPASSDLHVSVAFDLPMFVVFASGALDGQLVLPILFGGGLEYFFARDIALTFNLRMGPMIYTGGGYTDFGFHGLLGFAFRL